MIPLDWPTPADLAATAETPWVVSAPGTPCRLSTSEVWRQAGINPPIAAEAGELGSLVALIAAGAGIGLLPRLGIPSDAGRTRSVPGVPTIVRTIYAVTRRTRDDGPVADAVAALHRIADGITA